MDDALTPGPLSRFSGEGRLDNESLIPNPEPRI